MDKDLQEVRFVLRDFTVVYRGQHDIIALIAKNEHCSMNKARKIFTKMAKCGYLYYYITSKNQIKNKRVYLEKDLNNLVSNSFKDIF